MMENLVLSLQEKISEKKRLEKRKFLLSLDVQDRQDLLLILKSGYIKKGQKKRLKT